jgi:hypothetical protein
VRELERQELARERTPALQRHQNEGERNQPRPERGAQAQRVEQGRIAEERSRQEEKKEREQRRLEQERRSKQEQERRLQ